MKLKDALDITEQINALHKEISLNTSVGYKITDNISTDKIYVADWDDLEDKMYEVWEQDFADRIMDELESAEIEHSFVTIKFTYDGDDIEIRLEVVNF